MKKGQLSTIWFSLFLKKTLQTFSFAYQLPLLSDSLHVFKCGLHVTMTTKNIYCHFSLSMIFAKNLLFIFLWYSHCHISMQESKLHRKLLVSVLLSSLLSLSHLPSISSANLPIKALLWSSWERERKMGRLRCWCWCW